MLLTLILLPVQSFAIPYDYRVVGQFQINGVTNYVTGNVTISDEFLYHARVGSSLAYFSFNISRFSLVLNGPIGQFNISGDCGNLEYLPTVIDPQTGNWLYERQWDFSNSSTMDSISKSHDPGGDHPSVGFYTSDMQLYNPISSDHFGELASYITLLAPDFLSQLPRTNFKLGGGELELTRETAPVPEPSIFFFLGIGLVGIWFIMKRIEI